MKKINRPLRNAFIQQIKWDHLVGVVSAAKTIAQNTWSIEEHILLWQLHLNWLATRSAWTLLFRLEKFQWIVSFFYSKISKHSVVNRSQSENEFDFVQTLCVYRIHCMCVSLLDVVTLGYKMRNTVMMQTNGNSFNCSAALFSRRENMPHNKGV